MIHLSLDIKMVLDKFQTFLLSERGDINIKVNYDPLCTSIII